MSGTVSISKLKSELRQAQRLISRNDKLNANLRVETERRVESLKSLIEGEQRRRGDQEINGSTATATSIQHVAPGSEHALTEEATESAAAGVTKTKSKNRKSAKEDKYKMLRHVEYQKSTRRLKQAERELAAVTAQLEALPVDDDSKTTRKANKALQKEKSTAQTKREHALIDAWYGVILPANFKYVALYPAGNYVEFGELPALPEVPASATSDAALSIYTAGTPPARKPDEVRSYWRAVVKAKLARGDLQGTPQKSKTPSNGTPKVRKSGTVQRKTGKLSETAESKVVGAEQDNEDVDDFFE